MGHGQVNILIFVSLSSILDLDKNDTSHHFFNVEHKNIFCRPMGHQFNLAWLTTLWIM